MVSRLESCTECRRQAEAAGPDAWKALAGWLASLEGHVPREGTLHEAMSSLSSVIPSSRVSMVVPLPNRHLRVIASSDSDRMGDLLILLERYPELERVLESGEPLFIPDVARSELMAPVLPFVTGSGVVGIIAVPARLEGISAILRLITRDRPLEPEDFTRARAAAHLLGHLPENPEGDAPAADSWMDLALRVADVVLDVLANGRIHRVWGDAASVFHRPAGELEGASCHSLFDPGENDASCRNMQRVFESATARRIESVTATTATDPPKRCRMWAVPRRGIVPGILVGLRVDRPGEKGLRVGDIPVGAVLIEDGNIAGVNALAAELLRSEPGELAGRPAGSVPGLLEHRGDRPPFSVVRRPPGNTPVSRELLLLVPDQRDGEAHERERRLREALARQAAELEEAHARAEDLEALTSRFLASSAHELKTPLTVLQSYLEILSSDLSEGLSEEQRSFLQIAYRNVLRLKRLVVDLVELAALEGGKIHLQIDRVEAGSVVDAVMEDMGPLAREAGLELLVELPEDLPDLRADALRVQQVLYNLLDNAIKYTNPGGTVTLSGRREGDSVVLEVRDTGIGIPDEQVHSIFDPFVRIPPEDRRSVGGSGLGLTISRRITSALGGRLTLSSTHGEGSVFSLHLPVWPATDPDTDE